MVDFYDSLEDVTAEDECSPDSLDCYPGNYLSEQSDVHQSLKLNKLKNVHFVLKKQCSEPNIPQEEGFSNNPENKEINTKLRSLKNGVKRIPLHVFNNEILKEKGLQLNSDGSFTKSPRTDLEELPFVTREYRNLQFQRRKTYQGVPASSSANVSLKAGCSEKPGSGASMVNILRAGRRKRSMEEQLVSSGLAPSSLKGVSPKQSMAEENLTDSMKEILLQKQTKFFPKNFSTSQHLRQVKRVMNLLDNSKLLKESKLLEKQHWCCDDKHTLPEIVREKCQIHPIQKRSQAHCNLLTRKPELSQNDTGKYSNTKIFKNQSEVMIMSGKPHLSYSERRQKAEGFNPMSLRLGSKKVPSDSNRSNFGDSVADRLSEVSSTVPDREGIQDDGEDEELFYRKIMEKESRGLGTTAKSEHPLNIRKCKNWPENSVKVQKEVPHNKEANSWHQRASKSTSIDMPAKLQQPVKTQKKNSHFCSKNSSVTVSKNELAIRAKAYGYMANARNIFKLKTNPDSKLIQSSSNTLDCTKSTTRGPKFKHRILREGLIKEKSFPENINSNVKLKERDNVAKKTRSLCKTEKYKIMAEKEKGFILPRLDTYRNDNKLKSEILKEVTSCIAGLDNLFNSPSAQHSGKEV